MLLEFINTIVWLFGLLVFLRISWLGHNYLRSKLDVGIIAISSAIAVFATLIFSASAFFGTMTGADANTWNNVPPWGAIILRLFIFAPALLSFEVLQHRILHQHRPRQEEWDVICRKIQTTKSESLTERSGSLSSPVQQDKEQ